VEDIEALIDMINADLAAQGNIGCSDKVNVVTHSLGAGEVLAGLAGNANLADKINLVLNYAPCPIPTFFNNSASDWRMLSETAPSPRELDQIVEEDISGRRELGHSHYYYNSYWDRVERYCNWYPSSCYNYCDWYPGYCDQFCERFPDYCVPQPPAAIKNRQFFLDLFDELDIYSRYGPTWADEVEDICEEVSYWSCHAFRSTVDDGNKEMSIQQWEHMWQQSYHRKFNEYSGTFGEDGWTAAIPEINVAAIATKMVNFYPSEDDVCDKDLNKALMDTITG